MVLLWATSCIEPPSPVVLCEFELYGLKSLVANELWGTEASNVVSSITDFRITAKKVESEEFKEDYLMVTVFNCRHSTNTVAI